MTFLQYSGYGSPPGNYAEIEAQERQVWWGTFDYIKNFIVGGVIFDSSATDAGNTGNTKTLRGGLTIGFNNTTKKAVPWASGASDGTQKLSAILLHDLSLERHGQNQDKFVGWVLIGGNLKAKELIITGETAPGLVGKTDEAAVRTALANNFLLDDDPFVA